MVAWAELEAPALLAVLDVDSDRLAAFDEEDRRGLERLVGWFANAGNG